MLEHCLALMNNKVNCAYPMWFTCRKGTLLFLQIK